MLRLNVCFGRLCNGGGLRLLLPSKGSGGDRQRINDPFTFKAATRR
jgi:hypothetical protein